MTETSKHQRTLTVRMPPETYEGLSDVSHLTGESMNQLALEGIQRVLADPRRQQVREIVDRARVEYADVLEQLADS